MTISRGTRALATSAALMVAMTSCAGEPKPGAAKTSNSASPEPTTAASDPPPTPTSSPSSDTEVAASTAARAVRDYYATVDQVRQRPRVPLARLSAVSTSVELSSLETLIGGQRGKSQRQTGNTRIVELEVQSVNLDNSDPKAGKVPTAQVDVCWDVSKVDVVDAHGQSIVNPSRPDSGWSRLTVANYRYKHNPTGGWRVATSQDLTRSPCVPS